MPIFTNLAALVRLLPKGRCLIALAAALCASLASITLMGASAWLITSAAFQPPLYTLALAITLVRACGIGRAVFRYLDRLLSHRAVFTLLAKLRTQVFLLAEQLLPEKNGKYQQSVFLHSLTTGIDELRDMYLRALAPLVSSFLLAILAGAVLSYLYADAVLLPLSIWLLTILSSIFLAKPVQDTKLATAYRTSLRDSWQGLPDLQSNANLAFIQQRLDAQAAALTQERQRLHKTDAAADTLAGIWAALAWVGIFYLLLPAIYAGSLSLINLAVCLLTLQSAFTEFQALPAACRSLLPAKKQLPVLSKPPVTYNIAPPMTSTTKNDEKSGTQQEICLEAKKIGFAYQESAVILQNINFQIKAGEKVIVAGESGCGKTTLFHLLTRLWEPDTGSFYLHGKSYTQYTPTEIRQHFAICTQAGYIFSDSIRKNFLRLYPAITEAKIWQALDTALLSDEIKTLPSSLDTPLGEDGATLSGGQRQRLLLALAFSSTAPILLLDEPTAGIGQSMASKLLDNIFQAFADRTILLITHDLDLVGSKIKNLPQSRIESIF